MRGAHDDAIDEQAGRATEADEEGVLAAPRPPGGKALLRLLNLLGAAGYDGAAQAANRRPARRQRSATPRSVTSAAASFQFRGSQQ
jgi:hypothetical protein